MDATNAEYHSNMVSNLPLLFANGYPTSLEKITEAQIQNFIPFMVQCSLGNINTSGKEIYTEPEWWPEDIKFEIPLGKSKKFSGDWLQKMREIVKICYQFHKSLFLLRFCNELALYEHEWLRFINNYNSTTSLFDRRSNKLLVTFRNENMTYDQPQKNRKCLLQQKNKSQNDNNHQQMVEPALFDIYLCDNCDAELYSLEAITEHEKTCTSDDDVIICNSPTPERDIQTRISTNQSSNRSTEDIELRNDFLLNFNLQCKSTNIATTSEYNKKRNQCRSSYDKQNSIPNKSKDNKILNSDNLEIHQKNEKYDKLRRNRSVYTLSKCPIIPLSSPAGQLLIRTAKTIMTDEYVMERLDRIERFCSTTLNNAIVIQRNKFLHKRSSINNTYCTFKKPQDYPIHMFKYPRRQFTSKYRTECLLFLKKLLLKRCRPFVIRLRKITDTEIKRLMIGTEQSSDLNIKLIRDQNHTSSWKITSQQQHQQIIVVDTIDLCSSDEDGGGDNDDDDDGNDKNDTDKIIKKKNTAKRTIGPLSNKLVELMQHQKYPKLNPEITISPIIKKQQQILPQRLTQTENKLNKKTNSSSSSSSGSTSSSSSSSLVSSNNSNRSICQNSNNNFDGNFLFSNQQQQNQNILINNNQPKPLQPSVFLFSNYTTSNAPLQILQCNNNDNSNNIFNFNQQQNQENFLDSNRMKAPQDDSWLSSNNNNNNNNSTTSSSTPNNIVNNLHLRNVAVERKTKTVLQRYINDITIGSPNRTIDLTL